MADSTRRIVLELLARNKAAGELTAFTRSIDGVYLGAKRLAGGLLALAGIGGLGYMIKQQMEAVHTTTNLAARLGMTTEALVGLQHAAKITDVEQEQLTRSLDFFNRTLGDAQMGSASAAKAFTAIGISFKDLAGLNPEQKIGMVADQINKLGTQSQKAATVQDIFGRGSQALLGLLSEGSKGIAAYRLETEKLGLSFSQVDAAKVEMAIESLTRMRAVFTGLFRRTAIELAPYIEAAAQAFVDWATAGKGVGHNVTSAFEMMTKGAVRFGAELAGIGNRWLEMKADVADVVDLWEKATPAGMLNAFIREKRGIISPADLALQYRDQKTNTEGQINAVEQFYANLRKEAEQRASAATTLQSRPGPGVINVLTTEEKDADKHMETLRRQIQEEIALTGRLNEPRQQAKMLVDFQADAAARFGANTHQATAATASFRMELDRLEEAQGLARIAESIGQAFTKAFEDAILEAKTLGEVINEVGRSIQRALLQEFVSRPLSQAVTSAAGSFLGLNPTAVSHAGGIIGQTSFPTRMVDPGIFARAPWLHNGLASDEFPAILQRGEEVRSRAEVASGRNSSVEGASPVPVIIQFNVTAIDAAGTNQWLQSNRRQIASVLDAAIADNHPSGRQR